MTVFEKLPNRVLILQKLYNLNNLIVLASLRKIIKTFQMSIITSYIIDKLTIS